MNDPGPTSDPVLARRARLAWVARTGKRVGYALFTVAVVVFFSGAMLGVTPLVATVVVISLLLGSVVLVPTIILSYGVRGAERDERAGRLPGRGAYRGPNSPQRPAP